MTDPTAVTIPRELHSNVITYLVDRLVDLRAKQTAGLACFGATEADHDKFYDSLGVQIAHLEITIKRMFDAL